MTNFLELEAKFQQLTVTLDFDFVHPIEMLPASQEEIAQALIEVLRFSLKANSNSERSENLNYMAVENAKFSLQKLALFSANVKSRTLITDVPVSTGIQISELNDRYRRMVEAEKKSVTKSASPQIERSSPPLHSTYQDEEQGISFRAYFIGIVLLIGVCLIVRELRH